MMACQSILFARRLLTASVIVGLALGACGRRSSLLDPPSEGNREGARSGSAATRTGPMSRPPAGMTCGGRDDCPTDQVCVASACRYRETSVAGEILGSAAQGQVEAGDWEGAIRTYDEAIAQYDTARAPVPPELFCASAALILRTSSDSEARERGARRADACFRASLPGAPEREQVRRAIARLRFEGLDMALFDRDQPAETFFTQEPSRPTIDALAIDVQLPESEEPGAAQVREQLETEAAHRAIAECFVQDWEVRHARQAEASLVVSYSTRLIDMGTYDDFEPTIAVEKRTVAEDGFEPCVARALAGAITAPRVRRVVAWQTPMQISARVE